MTPTSLSSSPRRSVSASTWPRMWSRTARSSPSLSGQDVFDLVRRDPQWQGVPVLFITATPDRLDPNTLTEHRVIAKPFDVDELVRAVDAIVDGPREVTTQPGL